MRRPWTRFDDDRRAEGFVAAGYSVAAVAAFGVSRPFVSRTALARGVAAAVAVAAVGALGAAPREACAQAGPEAGGAGGAPAAGAPGAGGGGQAGAEKAGTGGAAPAAKRRPEGVDTKIVIYVEGPKAADVRNEIEMALPPGVTLLPAGPFVEALRKQGLVPLAKSIKGPAERQEAAAKIQAAAREVGAQAAIVANAPAAKGGRYDVPLLIVPADDPTPLASTNAKASAKGGAQGRAEALAGFVSPAVSGLVPIVAPGPEKAEEPKAEGPKAEGPKAEGPKAEEPKAEEPKAEEPKVEGPEAEEPKVNKFVRGKFVLEGAVGTQGRSFFYIFPPNLERGDDTKPYDLLAAPHLFLQADVYPLAGPNASFAGNFGLTGSVGGAVGLKSNLGDARNVETKFFHVRAGPKLRFPLGAGPDAAMLSGEVTYSRWGFTLTDPRGAWPSFVYQAVRPGVGLRLPAGPLAVLFEGGYQFVFNSGALRDRFPNASVFGIDGLLGVAVPLTGPVEGRFSFNYTRYRGNLQADLDSATGYVAAGSVDQFFGLRVGVAVAP
jgi:hypothetical protein